jgi:hypothetical protein
LISKRRGRPSNRNIDDGVRQTVLELVRSRYSDFAPEFAREHLAGDHGFAQCTATLRRGMIWAGVRYPKKRRAQRVTAPLATRLLGPDGADRWQPPRLV